MMVVELVDMQEHCVYLHEYLCCVTFPLGTVSCIFMSHDHHGISDMREIESLVHLYASITCQLYY